MNWDGNYEVLKAKPSALRLRIWDRSLSRWLAGATFTKKQSWSDMYSAPQVPSCRMQK